MSDKIVFVVLHYLALDETLNCLMSIKNNVDYEDYSIVVVDNGSNRANDVIRLKKLAEEYSDIKLIVSQKNLGFAQGNNLGFYYAKTELKADFIVLTNNDVLFKQKKFCSIIVQKYQQYKFAVLGPKIYLKNGNSSSNPISPSNYTKVKLYRWGLVLFIEYVLSFLYLDLFVERFIHWRKKKNPKNKKDLSKTEACGMKLHGCCLIFSKEYIQRFDGLNPNTFLYLEEDILFIRLKKAGLISLYSPDLEIIHLEDVATNLVVAKKVIKRRFVYRNHLKSLKTLIKEISNYNNLDN